VRYTYEQIQEINNSISIIEYVSQYLNLKQDRGSRINEFWSICPFHEGDINASLSFNQEKNVFNCLACGTNGTLINFIMLYHKKTFPQAIEHILSLGNIKLEAKEYSEVFEFLKKNNIKKSDKVIERVQLSQDVMEQYTKEPIKEWLQEGIKQQVLDKYNVRYDKNSNAIVFPILDIKGNVVALKARTLYDNHRDLGIPKYKYYNSIGTNDFLFGLYQNKENILHKKEVLVFEGSKSVMLAEGYGYHNAVSLETNRINERQMKLLLELKCDIVLCLDEGVKISYLNNKKDAHVDIGLLPKLTNVYIVGNTQGLLKDKYSPVDRGKDVWEKLYESRYKI
jgi:DNA primase